MSSTLSNSKINIANLIDDWADLYADDTQANEEWAANQEVGADKELKRTLEVKTRRQWCVQVKEWY